MPFRYEALAEAEEENALPPAEAEAPVGVGNRLGARAEKQRQQSLASGRVERHEALEQTADVAEEAVLTLVDASISSYQSRGFKNLMVSFGCTGGQHRSVYLAEQLAKRLRTRNGLEVVLRHLGLENLRK